MTVKDVGPMIQAYKAELFKALAHPVRIRILELLREGERTVSELRGERGTDGATGSQQRGVRRARARGGGRKEGTGVHYGVVDPQVFALLDTARLMFQAHLATLQELAVDDAEA